MITVQRQDNVPLTSLKLTEDGFLEAPARVARVGVLTYYNADGKPHRELVPAEVLFDEAGQAALCGIPVTNGHPKGLVNADTAGSLMKGFTIGPALREKEDQDELLGCRVKITDKELIRQVQDGKRELSLGYRAELDATPGEFNGERYDAVQKRRIYNHLAVVPVARAGRKARLRLDAAQNQIDDAEDSMLVKIKVDGAEFEVDKSVAERMDTLEKGLNDAIELADLEKNRADAAEGERDQLIKRLDEIDGADAAKEAQMKLDAAVKARVVLLEQAKQVLPKTEHAKLDSLDEAGIMGLVLKSQDPEIKLDGLSADYLRGAFGIAVRGKASRKDSKIGDLIVNGGNDRQDGEDKAVNLDEAIADRRQKLKDGWRKPLAKAAA